MQRWGNSKDILPAIRKEEKGIGKEMPLLARVEKTLSYPRWRHEESIDGDGKPTALER